MALNTIPLFQDTGKFYVYVIRDPRPRKKNVPICVGKGTAKRGRADQHFKRSGAKNPILNNIIAKCRAAGFEMQSEIIAWFGDEEKAFDCERALIAKFGRRDIKTGTLCNLTDGGEGPVGRIMTLEQREKLASLHRTPEIRAKFGAMAALYRSGKTLHEIGGSFGITRERVRKLIGKVGLSANEGGRSIRIKVKKERAASAAEQRAMADKGCSLEQYLELKKIGREMQAIGVKRERTPCGAFATQRQNARSRGIGWELTLWQWWQIWVESGKWEERGRGHGYMMCRRGVEGSYAVGNVFIATGHENSSQTKRKKSGLPIGVRLVPQNKQFPYAAVCMINGVEVRSLHTSESLAQSAYLSYLQNAWR